MSTLLIGNTNTGFTQPDSTEKEKIEAFIFTAKGTGTVEILKFRTGATANTGVTSLTLGVYANSAGSPGSVLGQKKFTGTPGTNTSIEVTGLSISVVNGTEYWLAALALGGTIHYNIEKASGGTADKESTTTNTELKATTWGGSFADGPIGAYEALGTLVSGSVAFPTLVSPTFHTPRSLYMPFNAGAREIPTEEEEQLFPMLV